MPIVPLRFDGKVAIVTGAGGGLGKEYALLLASRGAAVVVNDLGVSSSGEGSSSRAADAVVEQIKSSGGKAVANYDSVEEGHKILETALNSFGKIDIVINNAGILRDRSFARISDQDWDLVQRIHLRGAFLLTRAAWPHFRKQNYGRIIMTSSVAGMYGNFGQGNYSAAKMGLIGLSNTLAQEGAKYNIHSNVIVPMAGSRLTQDLMPPDLFEQLRPEYVAPVVTWLVHEYCKENGGIFEAAGGWVGKCRWERAQGVMLRGEKQKVLSPESVRDKWSQAVNMENAVHLNNTQDCVGELMDTMAKAQKGLGPNNVAGINSELAIQQTISPSQFAYTWKDIILYALSVGVSTGEEGHLQYLYENSPSFAPVPTYGIIVAQKAMELSGILTGGVKGLDFNLTQLLHGEQYLEIFKPLLQEDQLESHSKVVDVLDKGSGAVVILDVQSYNKKKELVLRAQFSMFVVGCGNFGGKRSSDKVVATIDPPSDKPDQTWTVPVTIDQAALYRLNGDINPLHIDPEFAAVAGFKQPILHGLCTYGIVAKEVIRRYAGNDPTKFRAMKTRFVKPVLPGHTLQIETWQKGNRIFIRSKTLENGDTVLSGAYIDLCSLPASAEGSSPAKNGLKSDVFFKKIADHLQATPSLSTQVNALFQWNILKDGQLASQWTLDLRAAKGVGSLYRGEPKDTKAQCVLALDDDDVVLLAEGKLNPQKAFMTGKLKITGNIMLTRKLQSLFEAQAKL